MKRHGFTLFELIVVMGIVALLIGLMLPAVHRVRMAAARAHCQSNQHNLGIAFHNYLDVNRGHLPDAARVPSIPLTPNQQSLGTILGPYLEQNSNVLKCPLDVARFPNEKLSYEYQPRVAGKTLEELRNNKQGIPLTEIWLTYDFDPVHGPHADTSRTFLYADGHVQ